MTTFHGLVTRSWLAQPKGKHRLLCSCIKLIGVTSLGRHLRPACNQGLLEIQLNKKNIILTSIQCVFLDFRSRCYVTSGVVITPPSPYEGSGNKFGGSCLRSRIYPTPCFFESMATHARGLGRSLRFTHAQELCHLDCEGPGVHLSNSFPALWLVEMGHVNTSDDVPMLMRHVTL